MNARAKINEKKGVYTVSVTLPGLKPTLLVRKDGQTEYKALSNAISAARGWATKNKVELVSPGVQQQKSCRAVK
jgi:hypothetical protein